MKAFITGSGLHVPERVVSNAEIGAVLELEPERMYASSGIRRRRWAELGTRTSSLAAAALCRALDDAGLGAHELEYLLLGTMTPDRPIPGTAPAVQKALELLAIPALDLRASCCNMLYGLQLARSLVLSGTARHVALAFAEIQSPWLDMRPASGTTSMLFGDGASALIVSATEHRSRPSLQVLDVLLRTDGSYADALGIGAPGTEFGCQREQVEEKHWLPHMDGQTVLLRAARWMANACRALLERNHLAPHDVRWIVPHQANENVMRHLLRALGMLRHADRMVSIMEEYGNTSSASMGMALDVLRRSGKVHKGDYLLLPAFAAGFTWGAALCRA